MVIATRKGVVRGGYGRCQRSGKGEQEVGFWSGKKELVAATHVTAQVKVRCALSSGGFAFFDGAE